MNEAIDTADREAIEKLHEQFIGSINDRAITFQDSTYAIGRARGMAEARASMFDLVAHLRRQIDFSLRTFGPGDRTAGVCDHIRKELVEVAADAAEGKPTLDEWVDVIILGFDGAWRSGATPASIVAAIEAKQAKNEGRRWPDWRTADPRKAIEHDRSQDNHEGKNP